MSINILVADDDPVFRRLLCDILKKQGYVSLEAANGGEAIELFFSRTDIDMCILDVMMPVYDGWEVLREIRAHSEVPIIMLTALGGEDYEVKGITGGANDYISKPFSYAVFVARLEALLKKVRQEKSQSIALGKLEIDMAVHKVFAEGSEIVLNNKEYSLLCYLVKNRGLVLEREKILGGVWGYDFEGDIRTIDAHVKMLRSKLMSCAEYIKTIRGTGYIFEVKDEDFH